MKAILALATLFGLGLASLATGSQAVEWKPVSFERTTCNWP